MFCPKCGTKCADGSRFCPSCGAALPQPLYNTAPPPPPPRYTTGHPVLDALRELATAPLALVGAIAYSCGILFSVLGASGNATGLGSLLAYGMYRSGMWYELSPQESDAAAHAFNALNSSTLFAALLANLLPILACVGVWLFYRTARDKTGRPFSVTGVTMVKVVTIFQLVFSCVFDLVFLVLEAIIAFSMVSYNSDTPTPLIVMMVLTMLVAGLTILYFVKLIATLNVLANTAQSGAVAGKASRYVAVCNYFIAAAILLTGLVSFNAFRVLAGLGGCLAHAIFGIWLFRFNSRMAGVPSGRAAPQSVNGPTPAAPAAPVPPAAYARPQYPTAAAPQPQPQANPVAAPAPATSQDPFQPELVVEGAPATPQQPPQPELVVEGAPATPQQPPQPELVVEGAPATPQQAPRPELVAEGAPATPQQAPQPELVVEDAPATPPEPIKLQLVTGPGPAMMPADQPPAEPPVAEPPAAEPPASDAP